MKVLFIILALSTSAQAQIGIGHSVPLWGKTIETAEISFQVDRFSLHYFWNYKENYTKDYYRYKSIDTSSLAFAVRAIKTKYINFGGIGSLNKFPTYESTRLNFLLELELPLNNVTISYRHISNGFGLLHHKNQGYDSISIRLNR